MPLLSVTCMVSLVRFPFTALTSDSASFFLSLLISPLITYFILTHGSRDEEMKQLGMKKCPACQKYVPGDPENCRYSGRGFPREVGGIQMED
jgi:hypothetical protein